MRCQYPSCQLGSQESRRSSRHYGSCRGTWDTRSCPTSRSLGRTDEPHQHLCHRHQACSSRLHHHGNQCHEGTPTSRLDQLRSSHPCSGRSKELRPSLDQRGSQTKALQRYVRPLSSSMSVTHRCDGSRGDSGGWGHHSSTPRCE